MRALGRKKPHVFLGNARPKSNARAHLKQRKKHSGEWCFVFVKAIDLYRGLLGSLLICDNDNIIYQQNQFTLSILNLGWGIRVVVSTAAFHARVRGSVPGLDGLKETKMFLPHPRVKISIVGSLRHREVACSASDRQGSNFESCVWRTVSSQSSHHPQEVLLAQFGLYVHKGGLKADSFHFIFKPKFTIAIFIHYKSRIAVAILDL